MRIGVIVILGAFAITAAAIQTVSHAQLATSAWPMFRHDRAHTGLSDFDTSTNNGTQKWAFATGSIVESSPAIGADGTIYVSSLTTLFAIKPDGTQKWAAPAGSSPAIGADGTIYVGADDPAYPYHPYLYALGPDGAQKWRFATGNYSALFTDPTISADGTIYFAATDGGRSTSSHVYAVNPNGTQKWAFSTPDWVDPSPAIDADGTVYVGSRDYNLYAISPDGTQKWKFPTAGRVQSSVAIGADHTIYVGSEDGNLYAINPDGTQQWKFPTGDWVHSSPAIGADGTIYVGSEDRHLYAINPDGTQKWKFDTGGPVDSSAAIGADGTIYVGAWDQTFFAINPDGTQKWQFPYHGIAPSSPAIGTDGTVYVGSEDGNLYALGAGGPTPTASVTPTPGKTATATPTKTPISTSTQTSTPTPAKTATASPTRTATMTPTRTASATPTSTPAASAALSFLPKTVSFPPEVVLGSNGHTSQPKNLAVINLKNRKQHATVMITDISASPAAEFNASKSCLGPLAPGAQCKVAIRFTPDALGIRPGTLSVNSNASNPQLAIPLRGVGKQGKIVISPRSLNLGKVMAGSMAQKPVTLKNRNPVPMHIGEITSEDEMQFQSQGCANTDIPAGGACTLNVRFTPKNRGRQSTMLVINDNAAGGPQFVKLLGTGQ